MAKERNLMRRWRLAVLLAAPLVLALGWYLFTWASRTTSLCEAVRDNDATSVRRLLRDGASIQERDESGYMPLHLAAAEGNVEIVVLLLNAGADVNARSSRVFSALDRNSQPSGDDSPLHLATWHAIPQITSLLLAAGADVNARNARQETPLHRLVGSWNHSPANRRNRDLFGGGETDDRMSLLYTLLDHGADVSAKDSNGKTPLVVACASGDIDLVVHLFQQSRDVRNNRLYTVEEFGDTLCAAIISGRSATIAPGSEKIVAFLLSSSNVRDPGYREQITNALSIAVVPPQLQIVEQLIEAGADVNNSNSNESAAARIVQGFNFDAIPLLLKHGLRPNDLHRDEFRLLDNGSGVSAPLLSFVIRGTRIHDAQEDDDTLSPDDEKLATELARREKAKEINLAVCRALIDAGADVNAYSRWGPTLFDPAGTVWYDDKTPLHYAVKYGQHDMINLLLRAGALPDALDHDGQAPLHLAAALGDDTACEQLVAAGANIRLKNAAGKSPITVASEQGQAQTVNWLANHGGRE